MTNEAERQVSVDHASPGGDFTAMTVWRGRELIARATLPARKCGKSFMRKWWAGWKQGVYWRRVCREAGLIERRLGGSAKLGRARPARLRHLEKLAKYERRAFFGRG